MFLTWQRQHNDAGQVDERQVVQQRAVHLQAERRVDERLGADARHIVRRPQHRVRMSA